MGYTCKFEEFSNYFRVDASGSWSAGKEAEEGREFWTLVARHCNKMDVHRALVVIDIPGTAPTMVAFEIASNPDGLGFKREARVAAVYTHEERYESNLFTEDVVVNLGWDFKAFKDERDAKRWLLDD